MAQYVLGIDEDTTGEILDVPELQGGGGAARELTKGWVRNVPGQV